MTRVLLLLIGALLSGCIQGSSSGDCTFHASIPHLGAWADYEGTGVVDQGGVDFISVDTEGVGAKGAGQGYMSLVSGDTFTVRIGSMPADQLGMDGVLSSTAKVEFLWESARFASPALVQRDHVSLVDGRLVAAESVNLLYPGDDEMHVTYYGLVQNPAILWGTLYWGEHLQPGWSREHSAPGGVLAPGYLDDKDTTFAIRFVSSQMQNGSCVATLEATADRGYLGALDPRVFRIEIQEEIPFPVSYSIEYHGSYETQYDGRQVGSLNLLGFESGDGGPLAPLALAGQPQSQLPKLPVTLEGVPQGEPSPVYFSLKDAIQTVMDDREAKEWLRKHPDALLTQAEHRLHAPNSSGRGVWALTWTDGQDIRTWWAYLRDPLLPGGPERRSTGTGTYHSVPLEVPATSTSPTMSAMAQLYRLETGENVEFLSCQLFMDQCDFGTHEATGQSRFGESSGATGIVQGMIVQISTGYLLQHTQLGPWQHAEPLPRG